MISVNSINNYDVNDDLKIMILAVAVIAIGMILFSGAIIATLTAAIRVYIDKKSKAKGKIILENHFVILNYNGKVPDIVYNLMCKNFKHIPKIVFFLFIFSYNTGYILANIV